MSSLRARLLCYTVIATAIVLMGAGLAVYFLTRASLFAEFDAGLLTTARAIQANSEQNASGVKIEADASHFPEFSRDQSPDYFEAWLEDSAVVAKSASLAQGELLRSESAGKGPSSFPTALPDGQRGRAIEARFMPAREDEEQPVKKNHDSRTITLVVARHTAALDQRLHSLKWLLITVGAMATLVTGGTLYFAVSHGLQPLSHLGTRISEVRQNNLLTPIELPDTPAELKVVVDRLNELLARLHDAISRERGFTADVAHELRTPLAGLEITLEISALKQRQPADYEARITRSLTIVREMRSMIDNLLTLARADAGQLTLDRSDIDLGRLVAECWSPLRQRAEERAVTCSFNVNSSQLHTDRERLRIVLHNLLDNAVSYCDPGGQITITAQHTVGKTELTIRNPAAIDPLEVSRVFDRFWRADTSRSDTGLHCGLGLSLCKKIMELLGGTIEVEVPAPNVFQVRLSFDTPTERTVATC